MKTFSIIAFFFLSVVAYGATTIIFDKQNRNYQLSDQNGEQQENESYGLSSNSQETNDDKSESSSDVTDDINVERTSEHENFKFTKNTQNVKEDLNNGNFNRNYQNSNNHESNNQNKDSSQLSSNNNQSERSSESFWTTDKSGEQHVLENDAASDGSVAIGQNVVDKIAALEKIIVQKHQCNVNLLNVQNPLPIKKSVIKVTKHNFVSFQNAELQNLKTGHLEYLSIDSENDKVYVECTFNQLSANGTLKTNLAHTKVGRFVVDVRDVHSNVSSSFHRGRHVVKPAGSGTVAVHVVAENLQDVDAIIDSVNKKYRDVLEKAVATEIYNSTHEGAVALLKTEMKAPIHVDGHATFDMNRTESNVNIRLSDAGSDRSWTRTDPKVGSMSYTRNGDDTYKTRYDVGLGKLQWTGDLIVTYDGQCARSRALELSADNVRVHVVVYRSLGSQECRKIDATVRVNGLRFVLDERFPGSAKSIVEQRLHGFIERSLGACMKNSLRRDVCHNQINNDNNA